MLGLSVAAVATAGAYSVDSKTHDQASSLCSPDLPDLLPDLTLNEDTKTLVWFERKKENIKLSTEGDMMYQPAPVATLSGRAIGVFEDSVSTASKWKKEAQETVLKMKGQFPNEYDVRFQYVISVSWFYKLRVLSFICFHIIIPDTIALMPFSTLI